jgi:hypothetical protein
MARIARDLAIALIFGWSFALLLALIGRPTAALRVGLAASLVLFILTIVLDEEIDKPRVWKRRETRPGKRRWWRRRWDLGGSSRL